MFNIPSAQSFSIQSQARSLGNFTKPKARIRPALQTSVKALYFIAFAAQAELMTFLQLGWEMPRRILDLFIEWRHLNNVEFRIKEMKAQSEGISPLSLLGACSHYGIHVQSSDHKDDAQPDSSGATLTRMWNGR